MDKLWQIALGWLRNALVAAGIIVISRGWANEAAWQMLSGAAISAASIVWGVVTKTTTAAMVDSFLRSLASAIVAFAVFGGIVPPALGAELAASLGVLLIGWWSAYANAKGIKLPSGSAPVIVLAAMIVLSLGGCARSGFPLDPAIEKRVEQGTANAADKALKALKFICDNYRTADAAFDIAALWVSIPQNVRAAEERAIALIEGICIAPPDDPVSAYEAAKKAWATVAAIRAEFKK